MQTRPRKLPRCDADVQMLHKQLNNDFQVQEYLHQHQIQHSNTDQYASLLNTLILNRNKQAVKLGRLRTTQAVNQAGEGSLQQREQFRDMEENTGKEAEISKNLEREIVQIKKSLNLLKGDIGHLVLRNESSQLLGSKVTKAKIVAEDQLKRVTLALVKDREEIKLRNQMQKKFNKKLKNVSAYQTGGLGKVKGHYVQGQIRRQDVYKKLLSSQKTAQNGQQMALLLTVKQKLDSNNLYMKDTLLQLGAIAAHLSPKTTQPPSSISLLHTQLKSFQQKLQLEDNSEQKINQCVQTILEEYDNLRQSLRGMSQFYQSQLKYKDELIGRLEECEGEERELMAKFQAEILENYQVSEEERSNFNAKLKKFVSIIKTYFTILTYLEQRLFGKQQTQQRRVSMSQSPLSAAYVNQLHSVYRVLSENEPSKNMELLDKLSEEEADIYFENMKNDIKKWLKELQLQVQKDSKEISKKTSYFKPTCYSRPTQIIQPLQPPSYHEESISTHQYSQLQMIKEEDVSDKAKRIKLLQDVDINYYKMIKATMRMEKENTRKNYQFLRTWKRAKYASRDQILEEKRFQSSFSVLCTPQTTLTNNKNVIPDSPLGRNRSQKRFNMRPSKTIHSDTKSTKVTFKPNKESNSSPIPGLRKVRSSILQQKQRKSRLTEKLRLALECS